ncbi:MAG: Fe-S cluster assembly protein SufD [Bacteroidota bacterium]
MSAIELDINNILTAALEEQTTLLSSENKGEINNIKHAAFEQFRQSGIPSSKEEKWKYTDFSKLIVPGFSMQSFPKKMEVDSKELFRCDVPEINTRVITLFNGWFPHTEPALTETPEGLIIGSFAEAEKKYPELFSKHYQNASQQKDGFSSLNTAFAKDGIFIYVPENVKIENPIQLIYVASTPGDSFIQHRNLIVAGKNSSIRIVVCDHSLHFNKSLINSLTDVVLESGANVDFHKMQNSSNNTFQQATTLVHQEEKSNFTSSTVTLHGGFIRNNLYVKLNGEHAETNLYGLYLNDREQHIDNDTFIDHAVPNCTSIQKFKGILDDKATGAFTGRVLVRRDAQHTQAFQSNNNILLTPDAMIHSRPQLEIYADDVKCSHGATIGQLDQDALFYLRSRGIGPAEARMLMMFAFASEVIDKISIPTLRDRITDMVEKRLRGELSRCNHCVVRCC